MRSNLEAQLGHWEAAEAHRDELTSWLAPTLRKLEDNLQRFVDSADVKAFNLKFQVSLQVVGIRTADS